ncbi:MAG: archease [Patescibacteria group bacterium]
MHSFDVVSNTTEPQVNARGTTRAGLLVAAIKGMHAVVHPTFFEKEGERERTFSIKADDFTGLFNELMKIAIALSKEKQEVYTDVRFDLITDKEAKGALIGKPFVKTDVTITTAGANGTTIEKNAEGMWEATVTFEAKN